MTDPARWLSAEIPEWAKLERKEKRAIRDFPVLWALFELRATGQNGHPNATPQQICSAVAQLADAQLAELPALRGELKSARSYFANRYFVGGRPTQAWCHLGVSDKCQGEVKDGLVSEDADDRQVVTALLLVVNRLRNNFLHGKKVRYGFRGQYDNFRHANNVLVATIDLWPRPL